MKKTIFIIGNRSGRRYANKVTNSKKHQHIRILMTVIVHQVTGTIDWPTDLQGKKDKGADIVEKCNSSIYITFGTGIVTAFEGKVTAFDSSTSKTHDAKFIEMNNGAQGLLAIVKPIADATPALAEAIYASCGFGIKGFGGTTIKEFAGKPGVAEGSVDMITAGGPSDKDHLHLWYYSPDGVTFSLWGATNKQKTTLTGLPSGKYGYFMTQLSIQDVLQGLSNIIKVYAK